LVKDIFTVKDGEKYIVGKHVYANLYGIPREIAGDEEYLRNVVIEAAKLANMTLYDIKTYRLGGKKGGISILALVLESHIAIHTWIEYRYATIDIYTCGAKSDPWKAFKYIIEKLKPEDYTVGYADRTQIK
jgi:S-adenosylmethionine decarboxylase